MYCIPIIKLTINAQFEHIDGSAYTQFESHDVSSYYLRQMTKMAPELILWSQMAPNLFIWTEMAPFINASIRVCFSPK
jgi:hypothetical protein